jgi:hypothetical protein
LTNCNSDANDIGPVPFSDSGSSSEAFGIETRQLFSSVTGEYTDFPNNGTALITTNVVRPSTSLPLLSSSSPLPLLTHKLSLTKQTLGVRSAIPVPVTFFAYVYLDYDDNCEIQTIRAIASIPTEVLGAFVDFPDLGLLGLTGLLLALGFVPRILG